MPPQKKDISRISNRYRNLFLLLIILTPVSYGLAWIWVYTGNIPETWINQHSFKITGGFTPLMCFLGFIVSMIKGAIIMYGLWVLRKLFGYYKMKIFFNRDTVACFKRISLALIWWVIAGIITDPLLSIILTMNNPEGQRAVAISFQSADLTALVVGGVLSVIARVMDSGRKLQEEIELTI